MKESKKLKEMISRGITIRFLARELSISEPTMYKRLKDGKFNQLQVDKIKSFSI